MAEEEEILTADPGTKEQIKKQILSWEEDLERLHCGQFRLKCYMASLQNGELPNPKVPTNFILIYNFYNVSAFVILKPINNKFEVTNIY